MRPKRLERLHLQLQPQEHRKYRFFVMIVHLDFRNIGTQKRDVMNDRIRQPYMIGPQRGHNDFHDDIFPSPNRLLWSQIGLSRHRSCASLGIKTSKIQL